MSSLSILLSPGFVFLSGLKILLLRTLTKLRRPEAQRAPWCCAWEVIALHILLKAGSQEWWGNDIYRSPGRHSAGQVVSLLCSGATHLTQSESQSSYHGLQISTCSVHPHYVLPPLLFLPFPSTPVPPHSSPATAPFAVLKCTNSLLLRAFVPSSPSTWMLFLYITPWRTSSPPSTLSSNFTSQWDLSWSLQLIATV